MWADSPSNQAKSRRSLSCSSWPATLRRTARCSRCSPGMWARSACQTSARSCRCSSCGAWQCSSSCSRRTSAARSSSSSCSWSCSTLPRERSSTWSSAWALSPSAAWAPTSPSTTCRRVSPPGLTPSPTRRTPAISSCKPSIRLPTATCSARESGAAWQAAVTASPASRSWKATSSSRPSARRRGF